jgi:hypothetical protein
MTNINRAISYIGPMDNTMNLKVYSGTGYMYHKYRISPAKERPYIWINTSNNADGYYNVYFFNMDMLDGLKFVSIDALFENPYELLSMPYANQFTNNEFFAPAIVQDQIIEMITNRYVTNYRQLHAPPTPNVQEEM